MQKYANVSGILGVALFMFGFVTYLFTGEPTLYSGLHVLLGAGLMLYFLGINVSRLKSMLTGRAARTFGETAATAGLLLGSVVVVNLIAAMSPKQFDWTGAGLYSLSEQTKKMLANLDVDVKAYVFQQGGAAPQAEDLLKLYAYEQGRFAYEIVDPDRQPELAELYEVRQNGTVVLEAAGRRQKLTDTLDESAVTNGLRSLLAGQNTTIGFLSGHGEPAIDDDQNAGGLAVFATLLQEQNYEVRTISLFESGRVPEDVDLLVLAAPAQPLLEPELAAVEAYMRAGGRMLVLAEPLRPGTDALLERMGIPDASGSMLIDQEMRLFAGPTLGTQVVVSDYGDHDSVANFPYQTLFSQACALRLPGAGQGIDYVPLLRTSPTSWAETDLKRLLEQQETEVDESDMRGPVVIGAAFTGFPGSGSDVAPAVDAAGVVVCDSDFVSNRLIGQMGNADLALNLTAWLAGKTDEIAIGPKKRGMSQLSLSREQMVNIFYGTVLIFPELLLLSGLFVWWQRKQRS